MTFITSNNVLTTARQTLASAHARASEGDRARQPDPPDAVQPDPIGWYHQKNNACRNPDQRCCGQLCAQGWTALIEPWRPSALPSADHKPQAIESTSQLRAISAMYMLSALT